MNSYQIGMLRIFHLARLPLFFFCVIPTLSAQQPVEQPIPLSLRFMSWEQPVGGLYVTSDGKNYQSIHVPANDWGRLLYLPLDPSAGRMLRLYHQVKREEKTVYEVASEALLTKGCTDFQIAVLRQKGEVPYRLIVLANDSTSFQAGSLRAFNFSAHPALIKIDSAVISLAPLEWRMVPVQPDAKYRLFVTSALQVSNDWIKAGREILTLRPGYRGEITIFYTAGRVGEYADALQPGNLPRALAISASEYAPLPADNNNAAN